MNGYLTTMHGSTESLKACLLEVFLILVGYSVFEPVLAYIVPLAIDYFGSENVGMTGTFIR
jgi:hypothetical protein